MLNDSMQFDLNIIIAVTGIIIGVIVLSLVCTFLPILIPVCICCCLGVGICGASRNRGPSSRVVTTAAPPPPPTSAVFTTTQTSQKVDYPTGAYPTQQPTSYLQSLLSLLLQLMQLSHQPLILPSLQPPILPKTLIPHLLDPILGFKLILLLPPLTNPNLLLMVEQLIHQLHHIHNQLQ